MFLVSWEGEAPPDKSEWLAALREALAQEAGPYRITFHHGERGWRFDLELLSEPGSEQPRTTEADESVARGVYDRLARSVVPLDAGWRPRRAGSADELGDEEPDDQEPGVEVASDAAPPAELPLPHRTDLEPPPDVPAPQTSEPAVVESGGVPEPALPGVADDAAPARPSWRALSFRGTSGRLLTLALALAVVWLAWDRRKAPAPAAPPAEAVAAQARLKELEAVVSRLQEKGPDSSPDARPDPSPAPKAPAGHEAGREKHLGSPAPAPAGAAPEPAPVLAVPENVALPTPVPPKPRVTASDSEPAPLPTPIPLPTPPPALAEEPPAGSAAPAVEAPPLLRGAIVAADDPEVTLPVVLGQAKPVYPPVARERRIEGTVVVSAWVDENGDVADVSVVKVEPRGLGFEDAALQSVKSRRYQPATKRGVPVRVRLDVAVKFRNPGGR